MVDPQQIIAGLVARGVPQSAAIGMAGNIAVESRFDPGINEIAPVVPGSRGGFGLIQWTGPRRRQLEAFAGGNVADLDTQLDFLVHELNTSERSARDQIYSAQDPETAARLVSEKFLRPGIPHLDRRIAETRRLAGGGYEQPQGSPQRPPQGQQGYPAPSQPQNALSQPQNALTQPQPPQYQNALAVSDFLRPTAAPMALQGYEQFMRS